MKLKASFKAPRLKISKYRAELQRVMVDAATRGLFEWLNAVTAIVPVWSGASQATFLDLANSISLSLSINPVVKSRIPLGLSNGTGSFDSNPAEGKVSFTYLTTLRHLIYNEFHNANVEHGFQLKNPGPYHFQKAGREAFERATSDIRLLNPFDFVTIKRIRGT